MNSQTAFKQLHHSLLSIYEEGEAYSIAAIVLKDAFGIGFRQIADNQVFTEAKQRLLAEITDRLLLHEPVQYVLGEAFFFGLKFKVSSAVLIPRQETEELVAWVIESVSGKFSPSPRLLDIGTGSGCIPVSIKKKLSVWEVHALDVSLAALAVASENAESNHVAVHFHEVDILSDAAWESLPSFNVVVSNPPYITEDERHILPKNVVDFEPHLALFSGGNDAQRFIKKIADFALLHLLPGGLLFFETNEFYATESKQILEEKGFEDVEIKQDLNGKDRMIRGRMQKRVLGDEL